MTKLCLCGLQRRYLDCCGPYLKRAKVPKTPEALMRSRYTAYCENDLDYIKRTMMPPASLKPPKRKDNRKVTWLGLEVLEGDISPSDAAVGTVEFKARYQENGQAYTIHEKSQFHLIEGRWYYVDSLSYNLLPSS